MKPIFIGLAAVLLLLAACDPFVSGERDYVEITSLRDRFAANPADRSPLDAIIKRTSSYSELTRANAVAVLGQLVMNPKLRPNIADTVLPVFVRVLNDSQQSVRRGGVEGLGTLGHLGSSAVPVLRRLHTDQDWLIRREADEAVRRIEEDRP